MIINEDFFDEYDVDNGGDTIRNNTENKTEADGAKGNWSLEVQFYNDGDVLEFHNTKGKFIYKRIVDKFADFLDTHGGKLKSYEHVFVCGSRTGNENKNLENEIKADGKLLYRKIIPYYYSATSYISLVMLFDMDFESFSVKQKVKFVYDFIKQFYINYDVLKYFKIYTQELT